MVQRRRLARIIARLRGLGMLYHDPSWTGQMRQDAELYSGALDHVSERIFRLVFAQPGVGLAPRVRRITCQRPYHSTGCAPAHRKTLQNDALF